MAVNQPAPVNGVKEMGRIESFSGRHPVSYRIDG